MRNAPQLVRLSVVSIWTTCLIVLTVAGVVRLRWEHLQGGTVYLDHWRGLVCDLRDQACVRVEGRLVELTTERGRAVSSPRHAYSPDNPFAGVIDSLP